MRFGVIGRTGMLLSTIDHLVDNGHELAFVCTAKESPEYTAATDDFRRAAERHDVPFFRSLEIDRPPILDQLKALNAEVVVSVNWPVMLSRAIVEAFPKKVVNCHGSLLPKYRGNAPPNWAILNGDSEAGATFHVVDPDGLDNGPIIHQISLPLDQDTCVKDIYEWLHRSYAPGFLKALDLLGDSTFQLRPQDDSAATRSYPRRPEDGRIDFSRSAVDVHRLIRASSRPFAGAFCHFEDGRRATVWRASIRTFAHPVYVVPGQIMHYEGGKPVVACGDGAAVRFDDWNIDGEIPSSVRLRFK